MSCLVMPKGLFGDRMFTSTDLNRRVGEVLNSARSGPVTISSKNNEQFALMRREQAASLIETANNANELIELIGSAVSVILQRPVPLNVRWLKSFDSQEVLQFLDEVLNADDWDQRDAIVHEWHESALAIQSNLDKHIPIDSVGENLELPNPSTIAENEPELAAS